MTPIAVLPEDLISKIAAGEVVERPASVVKELVENAIDAGARHVRVDVEDGGRKAIRVTDDGMGISNFELPLACLPHATSKIRALDDLTAVSTLGFRGEALSSIGAVSEMRILSRRRGAEEGGEILVRGGRMEPPRPAPVPIGTVVEVRDLFYNVPARAKFLRRASTEFRVISDVVTALAVARPAVGFDLRHNDRRVLKLPPVKDPARRIAGLLGSALKHGLHRIEGAAQCYRLLGFVSSPEESRSDRRSQYVIVQGRPIRDRTVSHALGEAYHTYLMKGRQPIAFLYIDPAPGEVDVNVHPSKAEARFRDTSALHSLVVETVRKCLEAHPIPRAVRVPEGPSEAIAETAPLWGQARGKKILREDEEALEEDTTDREGEDAAAAAFPRRFLQVHDFFVVEEVPEGIRIIDQHALHERIILHRLRKEMREGAVESQGALIPPTFSLSPGEKAVALERSEELGRLGYIIEEFGETDVILRSYPAILEGADHGEILREVVSRLETRGEEAMDEGILDGVVRQMACRGAVKAGTRLREDEIEDLLRQEQGVTGSFACAHGRPTSLVLTVKDLERQFGRK